MNEQDTAPARRPTSLAESVGATANRLQQQFLSTTDERAASSARAALAVLRRGAGTKPLDQPLIAEMVLEQLTPPLDGALRGLGDDFSNSERAAYNALTLFALHMQSADRPFHIRGRSFGAAAGILYRQEGASGSIKPRFDAMISARDETSRLVHARSLITLMRSREIGFDYGRFAADLRTLAGPKRAGVLLRWGRDFAYSPRPSAAPDATPNN